MTRFIKIQLFPILFSSTIVLAVLTTFISSVLPFVVPVLFVVAAVFYFCCFAMFHKEQARLYFLCAFAAVLVIVYLLIASGGTKVPFITWVLLGSAAGDGEMFSYFIALFIICCFFISSAVFYFTNVIYRAPYLLMIIMVPCLMYIRKSTQMPAQYIVLLVSLFFMTMMFFGNQQLKTSAKNMAQVSLSKAVYVFASILVLLTLATSSIKLSAPSIIESPINDLVSQNVDIPASSAYGLARYNKYSGSADDSQASDQLLFLVEADEPIYFISQVFGKYDGSRWRAVESEALSSGYIDWEQYASKYNLDKLFKDIQTICGDNFNSDFTNEYGNGIGNLTSVEEKKDATVIPQDFATRYVLAPSRTVEVSGVSKSIEYFRNNVDEVAINGYGSMDARRAYIITYYSEIFRSNTDLQEYARQFDAPKYEKLLSDLNYYEEFYDNKSLSKVSMYFLEELAYAQMYSRYSESSISKKITDLAEEITSGANSDYEKALALEQYFHNSGYKYDLKYKPPQGHEDIEYFIFESKTGTCGNYATAMTLLARSIGLNARYVEGFVSSEKNEEGQYIIKGKNSHAFTQVFIPAYGWVTFDATVASSETTNESTFANIGKTISDKAPIIFAGFSSLILTGMLIYLIFYNIIVEQIFRRKIAVNNSRKSIILIYNKVLSMIHQSLGIFNITAPRAAQTVKDNYGLDVGIITDCFERAAFNDEVISKEEKSEAIKTYLRFYAGLHSKKIGNMEKENNNG